MTSAIEFGGAYVRRVVDDELDELFGQLPAILLDGPKGVGKTETASQRCASRRQLDDTADRSLVEAEPSIVRLDDPPVLIDEWQRVPAVFDAVRRQVDADPSPGRYLLTGSPPGTSTHSGAGRITSMRMRPLTLTERIAARPAVSLASLLDGTRSEIAGHSPLTLEDYVDEIIAGGFPGLRHLTGRAHKVALDGYLDRIVDHDLREAGFVVRRPAAVRAWMRAYAAATGTTAAWEKLRAAAAPELANPPARSTTIAYTELLSELRIVDPLEAWSPTTNHLARLAVAPKHHLADPALAVRLLERTRTHLLRGAPGDVPVPRDGTLLGGLFESLAVLSVRTFAQAADARTYHLRTGDGTHEIDAIVERDGGVVAIEAKLGRTVGDDDVRHLRWLRDRMGDDLVDAVIVTTGPDAYRRGDGIAVVPLALLGP